MSENPWIDRFTPLLSRDEIRRRVELRPIPLCGIEGISPAAAGIAIKNALEQVFYPSEQCLDILLEWVAEARAHCAQFYRNHRAFLDSIYTQKTHLPEFSVPLCLTGLGGTGKTQLHKALGRLMPTHETITALDGTVFPLVSHRAITVHVSSTPKDILVKMGRREGLIRILSDEVRNRAYREGWAFLCLDEFQFAAQSDKANTRIVQMLMALGYVGVPSAYIANFSMLHKLSGRHQEEKHRLLSRPRLLHPESPDGKDWRTLLCWYQELAPDVFAFDSQRDAETIHNLTYGVKRALVNLLKIAFVDARATGCQVTVATLERAYKTVDYAIFRSDIEALQRLCPENRNSRKDLWCPISDVVSFSERQALKKGRQKQSDARALQAALTAEERRALEIASKDLATSGVKSRKVKDISMKSETSAAEQLYENLAWFHEKL